MKLSTLVIFRACYGAARLAEFEAVCAGLYPEMDVSWCWESQKHAYYGGDYGPSVIQRLPDVLSSTQWAEVAARCIGCKAVFQIIGEGMDLNACVDDVGRLSDDDVLQMIQGSWSMQVQMIGRSDRLHPTERRERVESCRHVLKALSQRKVHLDSPDHALLLLEDCRRLQSDPEADLPQHAQYVWLLLRVPSSDDVNIRDMAERSDVKKRAFIHTTTMPSDRALLMANLGMATSNTIMLDPFCGSGGLLLACSLLGANVVGGDVDDDLLNHREQPLLCPPSSGRPNRGVEKVSYVDSFLEVGLPEPTLLMTADIREEYTTLRYLQANQGCRYDAIVTDPPYGIRESQSSLDEIEIFVHLCRLANRTLKSRGRMVLLQVIDGTLGDAAQIHATLLRNLNNQIESFDLKVVFISLERFNRRSCRATIVIEHL